MALLLGAPASLSSPCSTRALSRTKPHYKLQLPLQRNSRSKSFSRVAASPDQEPLKVQEEATGFEQRKDEEEYELTEVEKSLAKVFRSRLWFVFLVIFLFGMYAYFITAGNGSSYIPMIRYLNTHER